AFLGGVAGQRGAQELGLARACLGRNGGVVAAAGCAAGSGRPSGFLDGLAGNNFIRRAFDDREVLADRRRAVAGGDVPPAKGADQQQQDPQRSGGTRTRCVVSGQRRVVIGTWGVGCVGHVNAPDRKSTRLNSSPVKI